MTRTGILYGIGVGPGDPELLTLKGLRVLQSVATVFVPVSRPGGTSFARSVVASYLDPIHQRITELPIDMHEDAAGLTRQWRSAAALVSEVLAEGSDAAFITEGDPLLYSTFVHLAEALAGLRPNAAITVVPGISSVQAAAAAAGVPLAEREDRIAILPATYETDSLGSVLDAFDTVVLLKVSSAMDRVIDELEARGLIEHAVYVRRCGWPEQEIVRDIRALRGRKLDYFSLVIVRRRA